MEKPRSLEEPSTEFVDQTQSDAERRGDEDEGTQEAAASAPRCRIGCLATTHIGRWMYAHNRGYHIGTLTSDPALKALLRQHELDCKISIPLPMMCMIEKEVLQILQNTLKDYKALLGHSHPSTMEIQERIDKLQAQLSAKENIQTEDRSSRASLQGWRQSLRSMLGLHRDPPKEDSTDNTNSNK